jgi:hypothetical protein
VCSQWVAATPLKIVPIVLSRAGASPPTDGHDEALNRAGFPNAEIVRSLVLEPVLSRGDALTDEGVESAGGLLVRAWVACKSDHAREVLLRGAAGQRPSIRFWMGRREAASRAFSTLTFNHYRGATSDPSIPGKFKLPPWSHALETAAVNLPPLPSVDCFPLERFEIFLHDERPPKAHLDHVSTQLQTRVLDEDLSPLNASLLDARRHDLFRLSEWETGLDRDLGNALTEGESIARVRAVLRNEIEAAETHGSPALPPDSGTILSTVLGKVRNPLDGFWRPAERYRRFRSSVRVLVSLLLSGALVTLAATIGVVLRYFPDNELSTIKWLAGAALAAGAGLGLLARWLVLLLRARRARQHYGILHDRSRTHG